MATKKTKEMAPALRVTPGDPEVPEFKPSVIAFQADIAIIDLTAYGFNLSGVTIPGICDTVYNLTKKNTLCVIKQMKTETNEIVFNWVDFVSPNSFLAGTAASFTDDTAGSPK